MTTPAKASRATGGRIARYGLRARAARAWAANEEHHTATRAARSRGASVGDGAGGAAAVRPTRASDRRSASHVSREGRPYQSVFGYTSQATAKARPTMLTTAASRTW